MYSINNSPEAAETSLKQLTEAYYKLYKNILRRKIRLPKSHKRKAKAPSELDSIITAYLEAPVSTNDQNAMRRLIFREIALRRRNPRCIAVQDLIAHFAAKEYEDLQNICGIQATPEDVLSCCADFEAVLATHSLAQIYEERFVAERTREDILSRLPANPIDAYPEARALLRHFVIHVGATNTGKTYQSLQRLKEARHGIYLSPLRLLALEVQERFLAEDVMCSMSTGEEEDIVPDATVMSCTVEKLHVEEYYDVAVLDECQMIIDPDRGYAWTRAILGLMCPEIHLCMAPEAKDIICKMIDECQDTYEIHEHIRDTELVFEPEIFDLERDIQKGDALIVFSKRKVLALASHLKNQGHKVSVIYGALPYQSRKEQVRLFLEGKTDIVVATDAIGMGMNLPIRRIVLMETEKFDGINYRTLEPAEVKQIAGRAGRRGMYDIGYVRSASQPELVHRMLVQDIPSIPIIQLGIPDDIIFLPQRLDHILNTWHALPVSDVYRRRDVTREVQLFRILYEKLPYLENFDYYDCITIPFPDSPEILREWLHLCITLFTKGEDALMFPVRHPKNLDDYETYYRMLDLYYQFCRRFDLAFEQELLWETKAEVADAICEILVDNLSRYRRRCRCCGNVLHWDDPFQVCDSCYAAEHPESRMKREKPSEETQAEIAATEDSLDSID